MNVFSLDFVSWWKAASILLAGFFGILGLLTEFKDHSTKRINKWGMLSLIGILISTGSGIYSQFLETADQNKKRAEDARQALQLLRGNELALKSIERSLYLLDEPTVRAVFSVSCEGDVRSIKGEPAEDQRARTDRLRRFCRAAEPFKRPPYQEWPEKVWNLWPGGPQGYLGISLLIARKSQAQALEGELGDGASVVPLFGSPKMADWFMYFSAAHSPNAAAREMKLIRYSTLFGDNERALVSTDDEVRPSTNVNNGKLQSLLDLDDAYLYIVVDGTSLFRPDFIGLTFRNGRRLVFDASEFDILGDKTQYFRAKIKIER